MKIVKQLLVLTVLSIILFSCKKDSNTTTTGPMTAKVDNQSWEATAATAVINGGSLLMEGTNSGGRIKFLIENYTGIGTYEIKSGLNNNAVYTLGTTNYISNGFDGTGSVNITSENGVNIQGTFQFNASNGVDFKTITNGIFNIKL